MARSSSSSTYILPVLFFIFAFCLSNNGVFAFGAGNIPSFAYMEGKAFRHGDIEDILEDLAKGAAGGFALSSLIGKGKKFNSLDIKRVYFGNWLRDYSQAIDIATLKKLQVQTVINLLMVLSFMANGYATNEFEVTEERLGCYLPTEHIDNPKGYGDGEDARNYHPGLRGPVDPRELEIDHQTGMKNYIANEQGGWDTSKALVRRLIEKCVHHGRMARTNGQKADLYEAYRLLGTFLHTLEDYPAHSNFCELALVKMGHSEVFTHVGDQVRVQAPNGQWVAPIVTGTFGSDDFFHSLLGGASDSLSEASVTDLNKELDNARTKSMESTRGGAPSDPADVLRDLFFSLPGGDGQELSRELDNVNRLRASGQDPATMSPKELHSALWQVLVFRDSVVKKISKTIEKIPGLGPMIEKLMDSISVFVFTTIEPFMKPVLQTATSGLNSASAEVIDKHDQYEVFNDSRASDPTHSFLSKDHFNLILNEPAGLLAQVIVRNTVPLITKAWDDSSVNVHQIVEEITQCMFHPDFHNPHSKVQREMLQGMTDWFNKQSNKDDVLRRLSKAAVRNHEHVRMAGEGGAPAHQGSWAEAQGHQMQSNIANYAQTHIPGYGAAQSMLGGIGGGSRDISAPGGWSREGNYSAPPAPGGEAASYYSGGSGPPRAQPMGHSYSQGGYGSPPRSPSYGGGPPAAYGHTGAPAAPNVPGYAPSYSAPPPAAPSFPGGPPSHGSRSPYGGAPSFPGAAPSFPGGAPAFPGGPPGFPGGGSSGYNPGYGAPPSFPGAPGGFPNPDAGQYGSYGPPPPFGGPHQHGHGHGHGPPSFPGGPPGW